MKQDLSKILFVALFSATIGFGFSQVTVVGEVKCNTTDVQHLKEKDKALDDRISNMTLLVNKIIEQNQEFINALKVQNELLMQKRP